MNHSAPTPECDAVETAVQSYLDGDGIDLVADTRIHCTGCRDCRLSVRAAIALRRSLQLAPAISVPSELSGRIVTAIISDRATPARTRFRARRAGVIAAIAACLLLAVGIVAARFWPLHGTIPEGQPEVASTQPLGEQFADAGDAVVSLTRRTADQALEPTRKLIPDRIDPNSLDVVGQFPKSIAPAAQSLQQVRQGAASGLEPMANSARRAFSMLLDMPPLDHDRKHDF